MNSDAQHFVRPLISLLGRSVFSTDVLTEIVAPLKGMEKQIAAFNMCDGTRSQTDIGKQLKLDPGNFSRTVARWVDAGVVFRLTIDDIDSFGRVRKMRGKHLPGIVLAALRG